MKLTITLTGFILILSSCSQEKVSVDSKPSQGDYWAVRYGYPTMQVDPAWFVEGRKQHEKVLAKIPSMTHSSRSAISDLSTFSFTALGPKPLNTFGGSSFAGRVNVIVSHPIWDIVSPMPGREPQRAAGTHHHIISTRRGARKRSRRQSGQ